MPISLRILVADDNEPIRNGMCALLEARSGWVVCGRAVDGTDTVRKAVELRPDIILVDVSMPGLNGFEVAASIHEQLPESEILIVTEHDARTLEHLPSQPGVRGYVVKSKDHLGGDAEKGRCYLFSDLPPAPHLRDSAQRRWRL